MTTNEETVQTEETAQTNGETKPAKAKAEKADKSEGKFELLDPNDIKLVTDEKHHLYDPRVDLPVDEDLVTNIMHKGVIEPVIVTKDEKYGIACVAGRQRIKAAREANKRLKKKGEPTIRIKCIFERGDGLKLFSTLVAENEFRENDTALGRALKMQRMLEMGSTEGDLAISFSMCKASVKNTLSLLECSAAVKKAVEKGQLPVSAAYKMSKMTPAEQNEALEEILNETKGSTSGKKRSGKIKEVTKGKGKALRGKKDIAAKRAEVSEMSGKNVAAVLATLDWVMGKDRALSAIL